MDDCPHWVPGKGWVTTNALTDTDRQAIANWDSPALQYDPNYDQCGEPPFHGTERAGLIWSGEPVFMCPQCFKNILGAPPLPHQMVRI